MGGLVVPLDERREARELERAEHDLGGPDRDRREAALRAGVVDQRLEILADGPELLRADVQRLPGGRPLARRERIASTRSSTASSWYRLEPSPSV